MYITQYFQETSQVGSLPYEQGQYLLKKLSYTWIWDCSQGTWIYFQCWKLSCLGMENRGSALISPLLPLSCCKVQNVVLGKGLNPIQTPLPARLLHPNWIPCPRYSPWEGNKSYLNPPSQPYSSIQTGHCILWQAALAADCWLEQYLWHRSFSIK